MDKAENSHIEDSGFKCWCELQVLGLKCLPNHCRLGILREMYSHQPGIH